MLPATDEPIKAFLGALFPEIRPSHLLIWGAPSLQGMFVQDVTDDVVTRIKEWAEKESVYLGCGLRDANYGANERGKRHTVTAIPGVWLDVDYLSSTHKKPNLPTKEAARELLDSMGLPPTIVIHTGHGYQGWWLFKEPWTLESDEERNKAEALTKGWCSTLRAKCRAKGWDADQVGDLPRVMRLPGTWNRKEVPRKVEILQMLLDRRYDPSAFEQYLLAEQYHPAENLPNVEYQFTLAADAEPPASKLTVYLENDAMFKQTWLRKRPDMQDQSQSSYDLALATRALLAGWTAQEIVNLLIAHRRMGHQEPKLRLDYYRATLNRASHNKTYEDRQRVIADLEEGKPIPDHVKGDKGEILGLINQKLWPTGEHKITKILMYTGDSREYEIELDGVMYSLGSVENLIRQYKFQARIADLSHVLVPTQPPKLWNVFAQQLLTLVETVESGTESTARGAIEGWLNQYLQGEKGDEEKWQKDMVDGHPFRYNGRLWITAQGFMRFLQGRAFERITTQKLAQQLRKLGWLPEEISYRPERDKSKVRKKCAWYRA